MFPNTSGVLFFGAEGKTPITWNPISEMIMDETEVAEEQKKIFATMRDSSTVSFNCHVSKKSIKNLMQLTKRFKLSKGPERKRMIKRAMKMRTNYISTYTLRKEGDEYVDERGQIRLVLQ